MGVQPRDWAAERVSGGVGQTALKVWIYVWKMSSNRDHELPNDTGMLCSVAGFLP